MREKLSLRTWCIAVSVMMCGHSSDGKDASLLMDSIDDSSDGLGSAACGDEVVEPIGGLVVPKASVCGEVNSNVVAHGEVSQPHGACVMPNAQWSFV